MALEAVDLTQTYAPPCDRGCGRPAAVIAKGCADEHPIVMCRQCFDRGIQVIGEWVHLYQKHNHRIMICGHCYRPVLRLDTHLDVRELPA